MTKQEEIREGITEIIKQWIISNYPCGSETFADLTVRIQKYEVSQGVRIAVDRELPKNPIKVTNAFWLSETELNARQLESDCFMKVIQDGMLSAGYVATEPLIGE